MSDSALINKIENLVQSNDIEVNGHEIRIPGTRDPRLPVGKDVIKCSLKPGYHPITTRLDIIAPSPIRHEDINVNPGEIDRLNGTIEIKKWTYLVDFLNQKAWQTLLYKPKSIADAEDSLIHFITNYNRINGSEGRSWIDPRLISSDEHIVFTEAPTNKASIEGVRVEASVADTWVSVTKSKFFFFKKQAAEYSKLVRVTVSGLPSQYCKWTWTFARPHEALDEMVEAVKARQKAIVNHSLETATL